MQIKKSNHGGVALKLALLVCFAVMVISFNACDKDDGPEVVDYEAGEIPGLGRAEGDPTGQPFKLPNGIVLTGDIKGSGDQDNYWNYSAMHSAGFTSRPFVTKDGFSIVKNFEPRTRVNDDDEIHYFGSGYGYVDLLVPLCNNRTTPVTVTFPAGTIFISQSGDCQNGVLIKKVTVTIPAGKNYRLCLSFYCGNLSKSSAHGNDVYILGVVSNAAPLIDLCNRLKNKKINIEEFSASSLSDYTTYNLQVDELQSIVWSVTDHDGLDESDIAYINSLPNS